MRLRKLLLAAFALSGMAALIYELTWIRPLQFTLGSTTYTVSIIFAAFMAGLCLGSWIIAKRVDRIKNLPRAYALMELGIGLYGVLLLSLFNLLPQIYNALYSLRGSFYLFELVLFLLAFALILIPTTLMGATFPVIARFYTSEKVGKGVGEVYAANNVGAILGSFAAGFVLIPVFGIKAAIIFAGTVNILIAFAILILTSKETAWKILTISAAMFLALAIFGNYSIQQMHSGGFYKTDSGIANLGEVVYYKEGLHATITVRELTKKGANSLFINGKGQGSVEIPDLRVSMLITYLPLLMNPESEESLVIGLGTGTTSGQLAQFTKVTTVEIEPAVIGVSSYFDSFNVDVLKNPNHQLVIDDGRNYLLKNSEKYDLIVEEPTDPWYSFSSALYSKEFFELVNAHLEEDGLFVKWIPIYTMSVNDFRDVYKTFSSVFPNVAAFANMKPDENTPVRFGTSEIIFVGSKNKIDIERIKENYDLLPEESKQYLNAIRLGSGEEVSHLLLFTNEDLEGYAEDAKVLTDDKPVLEFSTARKVLYQNPGEVIRDIENFKNE